MKKLGKKQCSAKIIHGDIGFPAITWSCTREKEHRGKHKSIMVEYGTKLKKLKGIKEKLYPMKLTKFWWE